MNAVEDKLSQSQCNLREGGGGGGGGVKNIFVVIFKKKERPGCLQDKLN